MKWENLREEEFQSARERSSGLCILPVGCLEKHGQHIPVGTDVIVARSVAERAAELADVVVFPAMYFGDKCGAAEFDGTVIFTPELRQAILKETCSEIARNGFKKILLFNAHGGNTSMLANYARSVLYDKNDYLVYVYYVGDTGALEIRNVLDKKYDYLTPEDIKIMEDWDALENKTWGHACFMESAWVYAACPESCDLSRMDAESGENIGRFKEFQKSGIYSPFTWMANYPNSYDGTFHAGLNSRIAKACFDYTCETLAERLKFLKEETITTEYHKEWLAKQK